MTLTLLILAYNEEQKIKEVVKKYIKNFEKVIVVNDCSNSTSQILNELNVSYDNLNLIENKKNLGAGKSFEIGMQEFINSDCKYLIKIDGDDQFNQKDVNKLIDFVNKEHLIILNASFLVMWNRWKNTICKIFGKCICVISNKVCNW